jgi:MFS family permease
VAFPLLAATLTSNPILVAGVAVAAQLPWLVISLPAGAIADRVNCRRLVVRIEFARALAVLVLGVVILSGHESLGILYAAAFLIGACETAFSAAVKASLPALVGPHALVPANGYLVAAETAGEQFGGPALGGVIFSWSSAAPFLGDALSFVASGVLLARALPALARRSSKTSILADVSFGLRWFVRHPLLRLLALVVSSFAFCQAVVLSVLVLYGLHILHLGRAGYGLFLAGAAVGNVMGGLLAGRVHALLGPSRAILAAGAVASCGYLMLSRTSTVSVAVAGLAIEALAVALGNVATLSLRQVVIPSELLGRVNNAFRTGVLGVVPLGALVGGVLAADFGLHTTFAVAGLVQLSVLGLVGHRLSVRIAAMESAPDHSRLKVPSPRADKSGRTLGSGAHDG